MYLKIIKMHFFMKKEIPSIILYLIFPLSQIVVLKSVLKQDLAYRERNKEGVGDRDWREINWEQTSVEKARGEEVML